MLSRELFKRRMTMATDNNEVRRREANLFERHEWKERPGFAQEKSSTGHSCNPREPSHYYPRLDLEWMVEGRWLCPLPALSGMAFRSWWIAWCSRRCARATDDGEPRRLPLKIRETTPGTGNVLRENEREFALNIERGLNSKISLRALHWARSLQAPAFERERWVLRDRNIYLRTCEGKSEWENVSRKERNREKAKKERERKTIEEGKREWRKGWETNVPARPWNT